MTDNTCEFCNQGGLMCASLSPKLMPYLCTRREGHAGDHVACCEDNHDLARWANDTTQPEHATDGAVKD